MNDHTQDSLSPDATTADAGAYFLKPGALQETFDLDELRNVAPARVVTFFDHLVAPSGLPRQRAVSGSN